VTLGLHSIHPELWIGSRSPDGRYIPPPQKPVTLYLARRTGYVNLPLHPGRAPVWLFTRLTRRPREIATHTVVDRGPEEWLRRLSDPFCFHALVCVLGFDWHSSGVTTKGTGALKQGLRGTERQLGVYSQGGKGVTSRKIPLEIRERCDQLAIGSSPLAYASRVDAKVDSAAVQDEYQLYHHAFFFSRVGHWCVIQQGMSDHIRSNCGTSLRTASGGFS